MSRKTILGRASLSFLTTDGVLDMDQILQTDPWTQIDNFVQQNFMQNVLNEFNDRIALDPKLTPTDKSTGKKRATSSGRSPRKSQTTDQTNGEKSPDEKKTTDRPVDDASEDKKEIAKKGNKTEGSKGKVAKNGDANGQKEEKAKRGNAGRKKAKDETNKTEESADNTQQLEDGRKATGKKSPMVKSNERRKTVRKRKGEEKEETSETKVAEPINDKTNTTPEKATITANTSKEKNSKSPIITSTPKCKSPRLTNSWHNASTSKEKDSCVSNDVSKHCAEDSRVECSQSKDINNNYCKLVAQSNNGKTTNRRKSKTGKTKEGQNPGNNEVTSTNEEKDTNSENKETTTNEGKKSKCKKRSEKTATKTDSSASNNVPSRKKCAKDTSTTKDSKDGDDETKVAEKTKVKREHKTTEKVKREKSSGDKKASGISTDKKSKSKCKKQDDKTAKIDGKQIGKFEKRLLEHRERHIRRHERKAERAMEEFSHHVTRIVKKMGYLPECSCSSTEDNDSDTDYSDGSSSYDSCCSHSSCSCCDYTDSYSEYTLCSSSSE